jgi:hypothetical protein
VGDWEVFTSGRVNAFISNIRGDGYPVAPVGVMRTIIPGGGLDSGADGIPELDANDMNVPGDQGTLDKWRVRSGFLPNILGFGVRNEASPNLKLTGFVAIWGTIESGSQRKSLPVVADFREGWARIEGRWGGVTAGRTLSLYSRGIYETDLLYGHGYGVGYHPNLGTVGPTGGMIGFGVLAASYNAGVYYTTPDLAGVHLNVGIFDPSTFTRWDRTEFPRLESELTYDLKLPSVLAHVFVNGAHQKLYKSNNATEDESMWGVGGGLRLEVGPIHLGGGGHYGRGLGMFRAMDGEASLGDTNIGPNVNLDPVTMQEIGKKSELRTFDGYSIFLQYAHQKFDVNAAFGQSRAHLLDIDKVVNPAGEQSLIKTQTAISFGFVYHVSENLHLDADYLRAMFRWYKGDKQDVNFFNAGATINW